jgi:hypothetical protein
VGLERGPLSFVNAIVELGRNSSGSGLETREYSLRDPSRCPRGVFHPQNLALTSPTSGGRSVGSLSVARVREKTIPTEQPPLVGEVSANFCG